MADGFSDDTFLHLVDAWWGAEFDRRRENGSVGGNGGIELDSDQDIQEGFSAFIDCKGDRFWNSEDLEMHFEEWVALYGGSGHPEACRLIEDVLGMWRSIEPKRRSPAKRRRT